jgi:hypothetical protein
VEVPDKPEQPEQPKSLISPPVAVTEPSLQCTGEQRVLLVAVEFPDVTFEQNYTAENIAQIAFGPENTESKFYPLESITAYYDRASYGRLHLTGDVYKYTARFSLDTYSEASDMLVDEIMKALNQQTVLIEQDNIHMEYYSGSED